MKRIAFYFLAICLVLSLSGCGELMDMHSVGNLDLDNSNSATDEGMINSGDNTYDLRPELVTTGIIKPTYERFEDFLNNFYGIGLRRFSMTSMPVSDAHPDLEISEAHFYSRSEENNYDFAIRFSEYTDVYAAYSADYLPDGWGNLYSGGEYYREGWTENEQFLYYEYIRGNDENKTYRLSYLLDNIVITIDSAPELRGFAYATMKTLLTSNTDVMGYSADEFINGLVDEGNFLSFEDYCGDIEDYFVPAKDITETLYGDYLSFLGWYCFNNLAFYEESSLEEPHYPGLEWFNEYEFVRTDRNGNLSYLSVYFADYTDMNAAMNDNYSYYGWATPRTGGVYNSYTEGWTDNHEFQYYEIDSDYGYTLSYLLDDIVLTVSAYPELKEDARAIMYVLLTGNNYMTVSSFDEYQQIMDNSGLIQVSKGDFARDLEVSEYVTIDRWHKTSMQNENRNGNITVEYLMISDTYDVFYKEQGWEQDDNSESELDGMVLNVLQCYFEDNGYMQLSEEAQSCSQSGRNYQLVVEDASEQSGLYRYGFIVNDVIVIITADAALKWDALDLVSQLIHWKY